MRRIAKVDRNQPEIVEALRKIGASVLHTHTIPNSFDILVGYKGVNYIMEIKDGELPPSKKKLTPGELKFKESWKGGNYYVVESVEDAIEIINNKHHEK